MRFERGNERERRTPARARERKAARLSMIAEKRRAEHLCDTLSTVRVSRAQQWRSGAHVGVRAASPLLSKRGREMVVYQEREMVVYQPSLG